MPTTLAIWHGWLLTATGSNIYTRNVVRSWLAAGHDVVLACQDAEPARAGFVHVLERVTGEVVTETVQLAAETRQARRARGLGTCTMVQADLAGLLPVFVLDRYPGWNDVVRFVDLTDAQLATYVECNAAAMRGIVARHAPTGVVVNHAVLGPVAVRGPLEAAGIPYVVKVHGSELEYAIAPDPERFVSFARTGLEGARRILVGSDHIARRTAELVGDEVVAGKVELAPPGVDLQLFHPATGEAAQRRAHTRLVQMLEVRERGSQGRDAAAMDRLSTTLHIHGSATVSPADVDTALGAVTSPGRGARADAVTGRVDSHADEADTAETPNTGAGPRQGLLPALLDLHGRYEERDVELGAAARLHSVSLDEQPLITFVGKLIPQKGPQLLIAALPLVAAEVPGVRLAMVGFGPMREALAAQVIALGRNDGDTLEELMRSGACLDGTSAPGPLAHLPEFAAALHARGEHERYFAAARDLHERVHFTGPVDHDVLSALWPISRASVVPSVLPEAFGMVAAEAASCGCPPVVADHSGLHDVARVLRAGAPAWAREWLAFRLDDDPVTRLANCLIALLQADEQERTMLATSCRDAVVATWGWQAIAAHLAGLL